MSRKSPENSPDMASCSDSQVDLDTIPLIALNMSLRKKLGLYLNPRNMVAADWMAVAETMGFTYLEIKNYEASKSPTETVLEDWRARNTDATVGKLLSILEEVERKDIVEDLRPLIGEMASAEIFSFVYFISVVQVSNIHSYCNFLLCPSCTPGNDSGARTTVFMYI